MLGIGLKPIQIDHVDEANLQIREILAQDGDGGERLLGQDVAGTGHHHVRLRAASLLAHSQMPMPLVQWMTACVHVQVRQVRLLVGDDDVDVVFAAQAVIRDAQQTVGIGRQIDPRDIGALVADNIQKAGILMREAVVILPPHQRRDQQIQR